MNLFKQQRPTAKSEHIQQLKTWTSEVLNLPADVPISISQLQCHEPGCPPIETVIAVMTQPPQTYKIHAAAGDISREAVAQALTHDSQHVEGSGDCSQ
ncbi:MAG: hypothetical protein AAFY20_01660 [Cyanobacteria bacterium J06639_14]